MSNFKQFWSSAGQKKRAALLIVGFVFILIIASIVIDSRKGGATDRVHQAQNPATTTNLILPRQGRNQTVDGVAADNKAQQTQIDKLREDLLRERESNAALLKRIEEGDKRRENPTYINDLRADMKKLREDLEKSKSAPQPSAPSLNDPLPPGLIGGGQPEQVQRPVRELFISEPSNRSADKNSAPAPVADPLAYLPPGAFFEATLINGMDAPTSSVAEKNPTPTLLRIKSEAILPNFYSHSIKECFVLASGYGSMQTERAHIRTEKISCVKTDGEIFESDLDGYLVGQDSKTGVRGRMVTKMGSVIAKTLAAGVLGGLASAMTPEEIPQLNLSSSTTSTTPDLGVASRSAVAQGFATTAQSVSQLYLELARQMMPIVEIDAGTKVTVMLVRGLEIK